MMQCGIGNASYGRNAAAVVNDVEAFEFGFKLKWQDNNIRLCVLRNTTTAQCIMEVVMKRI